VSIADRGYLRDLFAIWSDLDHDGCDTRAEVLREESLTSGKAGLGGCNGGAGEWFSTYDGQNLTSPADVDVDHVVALKEAWDSGAWSWSAVRRRLDRDQEPVGDVDGRKRVGTDQEPARWALRRAADPAESAGARLGVTGITLLTVILSL
jgi:hypothetical protein